MARPELRTTFPSNSRGVTLVEILIAMAIVVMAMSLGLPAISRITYQKVSSSSRRFVALVRTVRNDAILLSNIHRLVIDIDNAAYWVEAQKQLRLLGEGDPETQKKKEKAKKGSKEEEDPDDANFAPVEKYNKKPIALPSGVVFDGVLKEQEGVIKQGKAYINFFPSGFIEQSIIYLNKEGASSKGYSIVIRPTAGRVDIQNKYIENFDEEESK